MEHEEVQRRDAFNEDWGRYRRVWINPPFKWIGKVVSKVIAEGASAILVTPRIENAAWFKYLIYLSVKQPFRIASSKSLFHPASLDNEGWYGHTPWRETILWSVTAKAMASHVCISEISMWDLWKVADHNLSIDRVLDPLGTFKVQKVSVVDEQEVNDDDYALEWYFGEVCVSEAKKKFLDDENASADDQDISDTSNSQHSGEHKEGNTKCYIRRERILGLKPSLTEVSFLHGSVIANKELKPKRETPSDVALSDGMASSLVEGELEVMKQLEAMEKLEATKELEAILEVGVAKEHKRAYTCKTVQAVCDLEVMAKVVPFQSKGERERTSPRVSGDVYRSEDKKEVCIINEKSEQETIPLLFSKEELKAIIENKVVPTEKQREELVRESHNFGHFGTEACVRNILDNGFYWKNIRSDVEVVCRSCSACQKYSVRRNGYHPLNTITAKMPFDHLAIDLMSMPEVEGGWCQVCAIIDLSTRFAFLRPVKNKEACTIARVIFELVGDFGIPKLIQSDNGKEFSNKIVQELCRLIKTEYRFTSPYYPQANGAVERLNGTILQMLNRMMNGSVHRWMQLLPMVQLAYNNKISMRTGATPFSLMFARKLNRFIEYEGIDFKEVSEEEVQRRLVEITEIVYPVVEENTEKYNNRMKKSFEKKFSTNQTFPKGSYVMAINQEKSSKTDATYEGPYLVDKRNAGGAYVLRDMIFGEVLSRRFPPGLLKSVTLAEQPENIFEVENIIEHILEADGSYIFKVKWVGYNAENDSWEKENVFGNPHTISKYFKINI